MVPRDLPEAARLYRAAIDKGYGALDNLAVLCADSGPEAGCDPVQTVRLLRLAAASGGLRSVGGRLGEAYRTGRGVEKNAATALAWFNPVETSDVVAMYGLGMMYLQGDGVGKNEARAGEYFDRAAKRGHEPSAAQLRALTPG